MNCECGGNCGCDGNCADCQCNQVRPITKIICVLLMILIAAPVVAAFVFSAAYGIR